MLIRKISLAFILLWPSLLAAQLTQVSGTVKDPSGLPYANGTIAATLVISGTPLFSFNSFPYTPPSAPVGLDATGSFVMSLGDVNQLTPSGGTWSFHICSAGGTVQPGSPITNGPICFDAPGFIITGAAVNISTQLSSASASLSRPGFGGVGPGVVNQLAAYNTTSTVIGSNFFSSLGATLTATGTASIGGVGVDSNGVTKVPTGTLGNWNPISSIQVNSTQLPSNLVNFGGTNTPTWGAVPTVTPPTNGVVVAWGRFNSGGAQASTINAALVGDGSVNCLSGTGTYVPCGGGTGSGTVSPNNIATNALALYPLAGGSTTVNSGHLFYSGSTLTLSDSGDGNGVLSLSGNTSGTATFTAPAVAGTATNPILVSNSTQLPSGAVRNWNNDTGLSRVSANLIAIGNGAAGNASGGTRAANYGGPAANATVTIGNAGDASLMTFNASNGTLTVGSTTGIIGSGNSTLTIQSGPASAIPVRPAGSDAWTFQSAGNLQGASTSPLSWGSGASTGVGDSGISRLGVDSLGIGNGSQGDVTGKITAALYGTGTNCASSASPAVCGSSSAGQVTVAATATTVQVNTTATTSNSEIQLTFDSSLGTRLGVTCNTTIVQPSVSARVNGASFTITVASAPAGNPACFSYTIRN